MNSIAQPSTYAATVQSCERVVTCYSAVDRFFPACGLFDLTEGIYRGDPNIPYEQAETNQLNYLLDQVGCGPARRILDLGCGYGTLLERIRMRDAVGVGITISPEQMKYCRREGLKVCPLDYCMIPEEWNQTFDGVVANGSIEHFVQPSDAAAGRQDEIYRHMFSRVHRLIDPNSPARRFATTAIHFVRKPAKPDDLLKHPLVFRWGSDDFHRSVLARGWGGYYPEVGQLQRCAEGYFDLIAEVDGTEDYRLTSEEWLRRIRNALVSNRVVKITIQSLPVFARSPGQFLTLLLNILLCDSWTWQFRPPKPPMRLLRQTWAYRDRL